ncbi:DNA polymerase beta superfamily protein [Bacillus sp. 1P06AnD]|uniref:nucleotidyltransferase domain-containing protein n=1 Tax=Bacillus sp. 1P06AnD TaxID=3132208 RepID=UPI0039A3C1AA
MNRMIVETLHQAESAYNIRVLYACESGSRVWGTHTEQSDYDVRFIYIHPREVYLSIDPVGIGRKRDVIELPKRQNLDIYGWDLTKSLRLLRKSNPSILEWIHSPIIYMQASNDIYGQLKKVAEDIFSPVPCLHHYVNMAQKNYHDCQHSSTFNKKKWIYAVRSMLLALWTEKNHTFPPFSAHSLLDQFIGAGTIKEKMSSMLLNGTLEEHLDIAQQLGPFLDQEIKRLQHYSRNYKENVHADMTERMDQLFRTTLEEMDMGG